MIALMMEAADTSEILVNFYQTIQRKKPLKTAIFLFETSVLNIHLPVMCLP
jgi:hypothetical protein